MQKKIIAMAIAAAISAPAFADNANVTVYGKAFMDIESVSNDKSTLSSATRVQTNASRFGVKGKEDLGEGLSGWYQYEVQIDTDGNAGNGAGNGTRNSGVGLDGDFGTVMLGNWDTPFKVAHNKMELFDNTTVFSAINLMGRAKGTVANYNTRRSNDVQYWSPSLGGVKVNVSFSPDEGGSGTPTTQGSNKSQTSLSAVYDVDALYVAAAYETRPDASVATTADSATRLVGRYDLGNIWVGLTFEGIKVNTSASASYTQNNTEVAAEYKAGANKFAVSYAIAGASGAAGTTSDGATQVSLRYGMNLSKRTELFAAYTALKNDTNGAYGFSAGTPFGTNAGSSQTAFGTGLIVSF